MGAAAVLVLLLVVRPLCLGHVGGGEARAAALPRGLVRLRGGSGEVAGELDFGVTVDASVLRGYSADFLKYRRTDGMEGSPLDRLMGKRKGGDAEWPDRSGSRGVIRAVTADRTKSGTSEVGEEAAEARYEEWASDADVPNIDQIEACVGDEGVSFDLTASKNQWMSNALLEAAKVPGAEAELAKGVIEMDGMFLDATLFDLASLAAQDLSGKPQRLTARKVGALLKCVADTDAFMPTQLELNVFQKILRDFDMASDARKLLSAHIQKVEKSNAILSGRGLEDSQHHRPGGMEGKRREVAPGTKRRRGTDTEGGFSGDTRRSSTAGEEDRPDDGRVQRGIKRQDKDRAKSTSRMSDRCGGVLRGS